MLFQTNGLTTASFKKRPMKNLIILIVLTSLLFSCNKPNEWGFQKTINLENVSPIGLTVLNNTIWLADGDNNRLVNINDDGKTVETIEDLERPMHLVAFKGELYVPEYGKDQITIVNGKTTPALKIENELDAPAGIDLTEKEIAIADFYNHRILLKTNNKWTTIGKKGKAKGELNYPTDVQIAQNKIYVADAYNNRVQVFNMQGEVLQVIGENEKMNAATGIYVGQTALYVTDFENSKVHQYNLDGTLHQTFTEGLNKPTDIIEHNKQLLISNYKGKSIAVYN